MLVTGPTGSGKSTTLASLIDRINRTRSEHILTIEDPIEFLHHHQRCIVNQREIGEDATTFAEGLRAALRQDPDVILVGEMRDLETISTALTAAETGHLVFATLHTQSAPQTIDRVIDAFPATQQQQVRVQLAATLQGVVTQNLVPTADGHGRTAALEILMPDDAVRNLIRQAKIEQVYSVMQTSTSRGMQTMEQSLADLTLRRVITSEVAFSRTTRARPAARPARARRLHRLPRSCPSDQRPAPGRRGVNMNLKKEIKLSDLVATAKSRRQRRRRSAARSSGSRSARRSSRRRGSPTTAPPRLLQLARQHLPAGIVVAGDVRDIPALAAALDEFFRTNKLPRRGVRLGVATNRIGVRAFDLDGIEDERQLENAIRFRAHEAIAIPVDDAVIDYHVVRESKDENGASSRRIVLAAAYRESIDRYVAACKAADIELVGIDLEAFALLRAVAPPVVGRRRVAGGRRRGDRRSRPHDARHLGRRRLRLHARARVGRLHADLRDRARHRRHIDRGGRAEARALARGRRRFRRRGREGDACTRRRAARAPDPRARARRLASVLPGPARLARDRRRSCSRAERAGSPAWPKSSSA